MQVIKKKFYSNPKIELQNDIEIKSFERKFLKDKNAIILYENKQVGEIYDEILNLIYKRTENLSL